MTLNSAKDNNHTMVANVFIDKYMLDANGEFVRVYLYLLRCMSNSQASPSDIADKLNLTEKDVIRALKYWDRVGVIAATFDSVTDEPTSITFLSLDGNEVQAAAGQPRNSVSPARIRELKEQENTRQLLYVVETYLGKPLSGPDVKKIIYMSEELGFSDELIDYLVEYCVNNGHFSMRYIEKVALAWHDKGIATVEDAKESVNAYSNRTFSVVKAFGISDRAITPSEKEFIDRWYDEYGFSREIIVEACKRTILSMTKPNFSYADGILRKWKAAEISTMEDIKKLDAGFKGKISVPVAASKPSNNKFNNFSQRTYDFAEMEKALLQKSRKD